MLIRKCQNCSSTVYGRAHFVIKRMSSSGILCFACYKRTYFKKYPAAKDQVHIWVNVNRDSINQRNAVYYLENRKQIIENHRIRNSNKRKTDLKFLLTERLRSRIGNAIRFAQKNGSAIKDLGCSIEFL